MARTVGMSQTMVSRVWRAVGLEPHCLETFKLSTDPLFIEKVHEDRVTLSRLDRALRRFVDEEL